MTLGPSGFYALRWREVVLCQVIEVYLGMVMVRCQALWIPWACLDMLERG